MPRCGESLGEGQNCAGVLPGLGSSDRGDGRLLSPMLMEEQQSERDKSESLSASKSAKISSG